MQHVYIFYQDYGEGHFKRGGWAKCLISKNQSMVSISSIIETIDKLQESRIIISW